MERYTIEPDDAKQRFVIRDNKQSERAVCECRRPEDASMICRLLETATALANIGAAFHRNGARDVET